MNDTTEDIIKPNSTVILHINMKLTDGSVADSTRVNGLPAKITLGSGEVTPAFEYELIGMKVGDKKTFTLPPQDAFGFPNPANIHTIARERFPDTFKMEKDTIIEFEQLTGQSVLGVIRDFNDDDVTVDFNHPLCGQTVVFEVEIIDLMMEN